MPKRLTLKQAIPHFCPAGRHWIKQQPNLRTAWARCQNGGFMAWWLNEFRNVDIYEISRLASENSIKNYFGVDLSRADRIRWAHILRKHYTANGRRRAG